jgi:hypothetical protein
MIIIFYQITSGKSMTRFLTSEESEPLDSPRLNAGGFLEVHPFDFAQGRL